MGKKILCCFVIFISLIQITNPTTVYSKTLNYLALGDSIAYGYGLEDIENQSYAQIVKKNLEIEDANYKNLAISGITCKKFYNIIQKSVYTNEIKNADLITISIGSNELLQVAAVAIGKIIGIDPNETNFFSKVQQAFLQAPINKRYDMATKIYEYFSSNEAKEQINENIKIYEENWDKTIKYIKSINPDAVIIVTEFYNPYAGIKIGEYELGDFVGEAIKQMNEILIQKSDNEKEYKVAKIYEEFNSESPRLTNAKANVSIANFELNIDPHPNAEGHEVIASKILDRLSTTSISNDINIEQVVVRQAQDSLKSKQGGTKVQAILIGSLLAVIYFIVKLLNKNQKNRK